MKRISSHRTIEFSVTSLTKAPLPPECSIWLGTSSGKSPCCAKLLTLENYEEDCALFGAAAFFLKTSPDLQFLSPHDMALLICIVSCEAFYI